MKLVLIRKYFLDDRTIGELYVNDEFFCNTLEDKYREIKSKEDKIKGETAIPFGEYPIIIDYSPRFSRLMPHLLDVPFFSGIRIHSGNTPEDTDGCILVGIYNKKTKCIECSAKAYHSLFDKIQSSIDKGERINIHIK